MIELVAVVIHGAITLALAGACGFLLRRLSQAFEQMREDAVHNQAFSQQYNEALLDRLMTHSWEEYAAVRTQAPSTGEKVAATDEVREAVREASMFSGGLDERDDTEGDFHTDLREAIARGQSLEQHPTIG